jgi:sugar lactone lactonase YvrE
MESYANMPTSNLNGGWLVKQLGVGEFERVVSGVYLEGLAVDAARGAIWYSDVIAGGIHGIMADGLKLSFNIDRRWTGGVMMNADGCVLSTGQGGIMWNNPDSGASGWLLREIEGKPINGINEMMPDGTGGIYFGTNDIEYVIQSNTTRPTSLYRLTVRGDVIKMAEGIGFSNGIMLSPDRKRFYCNDTFVGTWAFDVAQDLTLSNKKMLIEKVDADGMALDSKGTLWITGFRSSVLTRLRPDGMALPPIPTPGGAITQIRFGGADMRDFYINTVPADGGDSIKDGVLLSANNSAMYRGRSDCAGMPIAPAQFDIP